MNKILILLLFSYSCLAQDKSIFKEPSLKLGRDDFDNFFIANRHLEPLKTIPKDIFFESTNTMNCVVGFDVWNDILFIMEPISYSLSGCLFKTCLIKSKEELIFFEKHFPKVKIPKRILDKIY